MVFTEQTSAVLPFVLFLMPLMWLRAEISFMSTRKKNDDTLRLIQFINTFNDSLTEYLHHTSISKGFSIKGKVVPVLN
jgi:hypothetical protein